MQGASPGTCYGLKCQARCISDVKADADHTSFITGTLSLKEENEVHLIRLSSDGTKLTCEGLFSHPSEIWDISSCPFDRRIFSTVFFNGESYGAAIWQMPELYDQLSSPHLERIVSLDAGVGKINCVLWFPCGTHDKVIMLDEENIFLWSLDCSRKMVKVQSMGSAGAEHHLSGGAWDPHDVNAIAATSDSSILFWDLRTMKNENSIERSRVRNVSFDSKRKHLIVTAENEFGICLWDLRMPKFPIKKLPGHRHWTWAAACNPKHDGIILSCGTDSTVNLWFASIPTGDEMMLESMVESPTWQQQQQQQQQQNPLLHSYADYEDSVYGIAWSSRQPLVFASLSYDGRVVVECIKNFLPRNMDAS